MQIKPQSTNCIEVEQDNRTYEILILDGLLRIIELRADRRDNRLIFRQKEDVTI